MTSADDDAKHAICKAYLREMFELNPMWQSSQILRRRELWTGRSKSDGSSGNLESTRSTGTRVGEDHSVTLRHQERVGACLAALQERFYQLPPDKLQQYLRIVQADKRPEISAKAKRLTAVAEHRDSLLQLQRESQDSKFSYSLCQGLISPPAQAGSLKEQYIESIISEKRVRPSCHMVRQFVSAHPGVYQLERDWFDLFLDPANERQWTSRYSLHGRFKSITGSNRVNVLAFVGLFLFFAVARAANTSPRNTPQRQPTFRRVAPPVNPAAELSSNTEQERNVARESNFQSLLKGEFDSSTRAPVAGQSTEMPQESPFSRFRRSGIQMDPAEFEKQLPSAPLGTKDAQSDPLDQLNDGGFPQFDDRPRRRPPIPPFESLEFGPPGGLENGSWP